MTSNAQTIPDLLADALTQFTSVLSKEAQLARVEVSENVSQMAAGLALIIVGAVLLIPALVVLLEAAVNALNAAGLAAYWSALIVGGAALIIGLILALIGARRLRPQNLMPDKTIRQLKRDASVAKEQMRQAT